MEGCHSQTTWKARGIRLVPSGISQRNQKRMYLFFFSFIFRAPRHSDSHVGAKHEAEANLSPPLCVSVRRTSIVLPIAESHPQFVADISLAHQSTLRFLLAFSAIYTTDRRNTYTHTQRHASRAHLTTHRSTFDRCCFVFLFFCCLRWCSWVGGSSFCSSVPCVGGDGREFGTSVELGECFSFF